MPDLEISVGKLITVLCHLLFVSSLIIHPSLTLRPTYLPQHVPSVHSQVFLPRFKSTKSNPGSGTARAMSKRNEPEHPETKHPTTKRAKEVDADPPYEEPNGLLSDQGDQKDVQNVPHWFRSKDLRIHDNKALNAASEFAQKSGKPLLCAYVNCSAEFRWHGTSPARTDFIFENLRLMQKELHDLEIPTVFLEAAERDEIVPKMSEFIRKNNISHMFANYEYEVDELRRDVKFVQEATSGSADFQVFLHHDKTVVEPGTMMTSGGNPMKIFTPYHKAWLAEVQSNPSLLDTVSPPSKNSATAKKSLEGHFNSAVPKPPKERQFASEEERKSIRKLSTR